MRSSKKARVDHEELTPEGGYKIKEYHPTLEQMKDFSAYIKYIHDDNGHRAGLAKIIPPKEYVPRKAGYADDTLYNMDITSPIKQEVSGESGLYQQLNLVEKKKVSVRNFKKLAEEKYSTPVYESFEDLERLFWKNVFTQPSIYGADVSGSLYDDDVEEFNLTKLNTILDNIGDDYGVTIQGVNTAYLYFGMWKTSFCWHTEDVDLYSINYLHEGAPKAWYCISPEHGKRFERLAASFFPHSFRTCRAFLRHKTTLISPQILKKYSIPYSKCLQYKGQFMITFPYSYHSGFNVGFNIAEATNFALEYWIDFGKWATRCECSSESVKISMQTFVKRYQADRYEKWLVGKDICKDPRDPKHVAAAPKPTEYDLYLMGTHVRDQKEKEEEENKKNALQQIQATNLKIKTKAARKAYPTLEETYLRYNEFLKQSHQNSFDLSLRMSHFTQNQIESMNLSNEGFNNLLGGDYSSNPLNISHEQINKIATEQKVKLERSDSKKRKKEEKLIVKKEKKIKEPILSSRELLQFLPLTFTHEKRFNRCIAALPPHCSVCQLLEPHPTDNEDIWGTTSSNVSTSVITSTATPELSQTSQDTSTLLPTPPSVLSANPNDSQISQNITSPTPIHTPVTAGRQVEEFKLPLSSPILLPRGAFNRNTKLTSIDDTQSNSTDGENRDGDSGYIADDKLEFLDLNLESSDLLQCSVCMLCVHVLCYGLVTTPANRADWICDRCTQPNRSLINCDLCPCRGGALKEIETGWVHLTCALFIPDLKFFDLIRHDKKKPRKLKISEQSLSSQRDQCIFCASNVALTKYVQGRCISCSGYMVEKGTIYKCPTRFHLTCAHRNGIKFESADFFTAPEVRPPIRATCFSCFEVISAPQVVDIKNEFSSEMIATGSRVVALSNGNYYDGEVSSREIVTYFEVFFPEQSETETNVEVRRIVNFDPSKNYQIGDEIQLKAKDKLRVGRFKGKREVEEYFIKFQRESEMTSELEKVSRKNIYLNLDQMPEKLFSKYRGLTQKSYLSQESQEQLKGSCSSTTPIKIESSPT